MLSSDNGYRLCGNPPRSKVEDPSGWLTGPRVGMLAQCVGIITVKIGIVTDHYWDDRFLYKFLDFCQLLFCTNIKIRNTK